MRFWNEGAGVRVIKVELPFRHGIHEVAERGLGKAIAGAVDGKRAFVWFKAYEDGPPKVRRIALVGDGAEIPEHWRHVSSDIVEEDGELVGLHLFQEHA